MPIRQFKPVTKSSRFRSVSDFAEITRSTPEKSLLEPIKKSGGRDNHGHISMRRIGGGHKRKYRIIDFKRNRLGQPATVREMLEQHRANPVCASCHARMDPLGFSLENFDAVGQWRATDGESAINANGVLLDGTKVDGPAALRRALVTRKEQFVRTVTGKLLTYAVGRQMDYSDAPEIRSIVRTSAVDDYRWSSTILAIVKSMPFQMRRSRS